MGCLPKYKAVETPFSFNWVLSSDGRIITVQTSTIDNAYNEIAQWRKNTFLVSRNNSVEGQHVSLKAAVVLMDVRLQKPSRGSKAKDHRECLKR